jgi:phage major head subunit gpT-like protein
MLVNHHTLGKLFTGLKRTFDRGFELATPMYKEVAMVIPSSTELEQYDWLGVFPGMREWLGDRHVQSLGTHQYSIRNKDWEWTLGVERNKIQDDQFGIYTPMTQRAGEAAALHPDELVFGELLNNGRSTDGFHNSYDGVPMFAATHPHEDLGTVANVHTNGAGPYWYLADLSTSLKPLIFQSRQAPKFVSKMSPNDDNVFFEKKFLMGADARYNGGYGFWQLMFASNRTLDATNLEAAWSAMLGLTADNGKPLKVRPTALIVPTVLHWTAKRLIEQQVLATGEENIHAKSLRIIESPHLANT